MREHIGPSARMRALQSHLPSWSEQSREMPHLVHDARLLLRHAGPTEQQNRATLELLREQQLRTERRWRRTAVAALLVAGALAGTQPESRLWVEALPAWGWALFAIAGGLVLRGGR